MPNDLARYDDFWAAFFGLEAERLRRPGVNVVRHVQLGNYAGVWFFVRGSSVVVSTPDAWFDRLTSRADRISPHALPGRRLIGDLFGAAAGRVIGPAYQGYLARRAFRPVQDANVRALTQSDADALVDLCSACTPQEWEHSGLSASSEPRFGYFRDGQLVAAAGTDRWTADAVGPGVLSHPDRRRRGYGTAVVSAVVEHALGSGQLPLYQTLMEYTGSIAIAERLGYRQYATHVAIRVRPEAKTGGSLVTASRRTTAAMNLRVEPATELDISEWLALAAEVGDLFGADMANDPGFSRTLRRNIARGTALCIRSAGGIAGAMLLNAGEIDWLAVLKRFRRGGVARALVAHAQSVHSEIRVTTFGAGHPHPDSEASRSLYRAMGFQLGNEGATFELDGTPREELVWRA